MREVGPEKNTNNLEKSYKSKTNSKNLGNNQKNKKNKAPREMFKCQVGNLLPGALFFFFGGGFSRGFLSFVAGGQ